MQTISSYGKYHGASTLPSVVLILLALGTILCVPSYGQDSEQDRVRLHGENDDLTMRFHGTLVDENSEPVIDGSIDVKVNGEQTLDVQLDGNVFSFDLPLQQAFHGLAITAWGNGRQRLAVKRILTNECRKFASSNLELRLAPTNRTLRVVTQHDGKPIPSAQVVVNFDTFCELSATSDESGVAVIPCFSEGSLISITAWKGDSYIGGYGFTRTPTRDPLSDEHVVELHATRNQRVRFVDEQGSPVPDLEFKLNVATPAPHFNYLGTDKLESLVTDENGEAVLNWFPDLPEFHMYPTLEDKTWLRTQEIEFKDNCYTFTVKPVEIVSRHKITGRVTSSFAKSLGGFNVQLKTFQGQTGDAVSVFTNHDGSFEVSVLPGATYCYYLNDSKWVSQTQAEILFDTESQQARIPELAIVPGQRVQIIATQGPDAIPMPGMSFNLSSSLRFTWQENGQTRYGSTGKTAYVRTDSQGKAEVICSPGPLRVAVYNADWRFEEELEVTENQPNVVRVHRAVGNAITVRGNITPTGMDAETTIVISAFDGNTSGQQQVVTDKNGQFEFETKSESVAIYAYSNDGSGSAFQVVEMPTEEVSLKLQPTVTYRGRLLGDQDRPLPNHLIRAQVVVESSSLDRSPWPKQLTGNEFETKTNEEGYFEFDRVPTEVRLLLSAFATDDVAPLVSHEERFIAAGETRPLDVIRLDSNAVTSTDSRKSFARAMKDCELYDLLLLTVSTSDDESTAFAQQVVNDFDENRPVLGYLPAFFDTSTLDDRPDRKEVFDNFKLIPPEAHEILLAVFQGDGTEVARITVNTQNENCRNEILRFVASYEPPAKNAIRAFEVAINEAQRTDRVVWAQHSQTRCNPCFMLTRWIDKHRDILEKDFVFVRIDDVRDEGGIEVAKKITRERHFGIPFVAVFDAGGQIVADFESPLGNIGFPSEIEGAIHLRRILKKSQKRITDDEIDQLIQSLLEPADQ